MKTPKQYAELLSPVDGRGFYMFYGAELLAEDVADLVAAAQADALEEAARVVEAFRVPEVVFRPGTPIGSSEYAEHPNRLVEKAARHIRSLKRPDDVTKQSDS